MYGARSREHAGHPQKRNGASGHRRPPLERGPHSHRQLARNRPSHFDPRRDRHQQYLPGAPVRPSAYEEDDPDWSDYENVGEDAEPDDDGKDEQLFPMRGSVLESFDRSTIARGSRSRSRSRSRMEDPSPRQRPMPGKSRPPQPQPQRQRDAVFRPSNRQCGDEARPAIGLSPRQSPAPIAPAVPRGEQSVEGVSRSRPPQPPSTPPNPTLLEATTSRPSRTPQAPQGPPPPRIQQQHGITLGAAKAKATLVRSAAEPPTEEPSSDGERSSSKVGDSPRAVQGELSSSSLGTSPRAPLPRGAHPVGVLVGYKSSSTTPSAPSRSRLEHSKIKEDISANGVKEESQDRTPSGVTATGEHGTDSSNKVGIKEESADCEAPEHGTDSSNKVGIKEESADCEAPELGTGSSGHSAGLDEESTAVANMDIGNNTTVALHGLCDIRLTDFSEWPQFFDDMRADIEKECRRHGDVVKLCINESATMGSVFVDFGAPGQAAACFAAMDRRYFAGRMVTAEIQNGDVWKSPPGTVVEVFS